MPAKRKFYVRRNTAPFRKAQGVTGEVHDQGGLKETNETSESKPAVGNMTFDGQSETSRPKYNVATVSGYGKANPNNTGWVDPSDNSGQVIEPPEETGEEKPQEEGPKEEEKKGPEGEGQEIPETETTEEETDGVNPETEDGTDEKGEGGEKKEDDAFYATGGAMSLNPETAAAAQEFYGKDKEEDKDLDGNGGEQPYSPYESEMDPQIEKKWAKFAAKESAAAGLGLAANLGARSVGFMGSMIKFANSFLKNPFSDPLGIAKGLVNAIVETGAAVQGVVDDIGMVWGIKDGVKQKDIAGTYKGMKYYTEHRNAERVQAKFNEDMGRITKQVFGDDAEPEKMMDYMWDAVSRAQNKDLDITERKKAVKQIGSLVDNMAVMANNPDVMRMAAMVKRQEMDMKNKSKSPKEKYVAPADAQVYVIMYRNMMKSFIDAARTAGAITSRQASDYRHQMQVLGEERRFGTPEEIAEWKKWRDGLTGDSKDFVDVVENALGRPLLPAGVANDGLPMIGNISDAQRVMRALEYKKNTQDLTPAEAKALETLQKRIPKPERVGRPKGLDRIKKLQKINKNGWGGSTDNGVNKRIMETAQQEMLALERAGQADSDKYDKFQNAYNLARLSTEYNNTWGTLHDQDITELLDKSLPSTKNITGYGSTEDIITEMNNLMDVYKDGCDHPEKLDDDDFFDVYESAYYSMLGMKDMVNNLIKSAKRSNK